MQLNKSDMCLLQKLNEEKPSPTSAVFSDANRGTRVESFDAGWLEKKSWSHLGSNPCATIVARSRYQLSRLTRCQAVRFLATTLAIVCRTPLLATGVNKIEQVWVHLAFVCSREPKPRGPAIKDYYAKNSHHHGKLTQCSWKWFRSGTDLNKCFTKSDTWFD